jgi:hypothetical protein
MSVRVSWVIQFLGVEAFTALNFEIRELCCLCCLSAGEPFHIGFAFGDR